MATEGQADEMLMTVAGQVRQIYQILRKYLRGRLNRTQMRRAAAERVAHGRRWEPPVQQQTANVDERELYGQLDRTARQLEGVNAQNDDLRRQTAELQAQQAVTEERLRAQEQLLADQNAELNRTDGNHNGVDDNRDADVRTDEQNRVRDAQVQQNADASDLDNNGVVDSLDREHDEQQRQEDAKQKKESGREGPDAADAAGAAGTAAGAAVAAEEVEDRLDEGTDADQPGSDEPGVDTAANAETGELTDSVDQQGTVNMTFGDNTQVISGDGNSRFGYNVVSGDSPQSPDAVDATAQDTTDPLREQTEAIPAVEEQGAPPNPEAKQVNPWDSYNDPLTNEVFDQDNPPLETDNTQPNPYVTDTAAEAEQQPEQVPASDPYVTDSTVEAEQQPEQVPASDPYVTDTAVEAEQQPESNPYVTDTAAEAEQSPDLESPDRPGTTRTLNQDQELEADPEDLEGPTQTENAQTLAQAQDAQGPTQGPDAQPLAQDTQAPGQAQDTQSLAQGQDTQSLAQDQDTQGPTQVSDQPGPAIQADGGDINFGENGAAQPSGQNTQPVRAAEEPLLDGHREERAQQAARNGGQQGRTSTMTREEQDAQRHRTQDGLASASAAPSHAPSTTPSAAGERPDHLRDTRTASPRAPQQDTGRGRGE
ncbi:hypothetical protein [Kribbella solani]|uniref:Uncharacterized protein n=1 Tax=Kribbella solani TaxID=236067 RepID=A0A841DQW5_9ACTN|nr:hypothetical protein [Kribbella solani]MBB5981033.1 hypothetical protein [Kribbella solani]